MDDAIYLTPGKRLAIVKHPTISRQGIDIQIQTGKGWMTRTHMSLTKDVLMELYSRLECGA